MGIRNNRGQVNTGPKAVEVWINELRLTDFDESGGWAANARLSTRLADLGSITFAGRTRSAGFGNISQNINSRQLEDLAEYERQRILKSLKPGDEEFMNILDVLLGQLFPNKESTEA